MHAIHGSSGSLGKRNINMNTSALLHIQIVRLAWAKLKLHFYVYKIEQKKYRVCHFIFVYFDRLVCQKFLRCGNLINNYNCLNFHISWMYWYHFNGLNVIIFGHISQSKYIKIKWDTLYSVKKRLKSISSWFKICSFIHFGM